MEFPALQLGDLEGICRGPSLFLVDLSIQSAVFFSQFIEMRV